MKVVEKSIKAIHPYANNPRKNDDAVEQVANSIREFGFKVPIIIDKNGEIVTGHTRLRLRGSNRCENSCGVSAAVHILY